MTIHFDNDVVGEGFRYCCDADTDATDCRVSWDLGDTYWLGHLQSDPDTSCDARTTWFMVVAVITLALNALSVGFQFMYPRESSVCGRPLEWTALWLLTKAFLALAYLVLAVPLLVILWEGGWWTCALAFLILMAGYCISSSEASGSELTEDDAGNAGCLAVTSAAAVLWVMWVWGGDTPDPWSINRMLSLMFLTMDVLAVLCFLSCSVEDGKEDQAIVVVVVLGAALVACIAGVAWFAQSLPSLIGVREEDGTGIYYTLAYVLFAAEALAIVYVYRNADSITVAAGELGSSKIRCRALRRRWAKVTGVSATSTSSSVDAPYSRRRRQQMLKNKVGVDMAGQVFAMTVAMALNSFMIFLYIFFSPVENLGADEYALPALGTLGLFIYGLLVPRFFYKQLRSASDKKQMNAPACRNRYGYLFTRFKGDCWGAEFRILARKSVLLFVTTIFAEQWHLVIPAQLAALGWALKKQCAETPFAEVGFARKAFAEAHPDGLGWSRGDKLEALSLVAQIGNTLISLLCSLRTAEAYDTEITVAALAFAIIPGCYGLQMVLDDASMGRRGTVCCQKMCCRGKTTKDALISADHVESGLNPSFDG